MNGLHKIQETKLGNYQGTIFLSLKIIKYLF